MPKPTPPPIDPAQIPALAHAVIAADPFPVLATIEGDQPRVRPVSPVKTDGFTIYVANLRFYAKTAQIQSNPKVELCYMDTHHNQLRITGQAQILTDRPTLEEIWNNNPLMRQFLGTLENPQLIIYKITPTQVRYMQEWAMEYHHVPI